MAKIEMTTSELAGMIKSFFEDYAKNIKGSADGISFTVEYDLGIKLVPKKIPLELKYERIDKDLICFILRIDIPLIGIASKIIFKKFASLIDTFELPDGISLIGDTVQIIPSEFLKESGLKIKINKMDISNSKISVDFKIK
jgi:uncharacterized protein YpmS